MTNALAGSQPQPEGETVLDPGTPSAPEQVNDEQHSDAELGNETEEVEGSAEGGENEGDAEGTGDSGEGDQGKSKPKKKLPWELRRIHEETNKRREAEKRAEELAAELEKIKKGGGTDAPAATETPDIDTLANQRAQQMVEQQEFQKRVSAWDSAGAQEFGREEFNASCNLIASLMDDRQQAAFMRTITDPEIIEDGHKVIAALAEDPEEAERILSLPPVKQALALNKLAAKVNKPATPAPKPISKAPPPVTPIGGKTQVSSRLDDPEVPMDKFADEFLKTMASRRR